jgi:hypothetical protein
MPPASAYPERLGSFAFEKAVIELVPDVVREVSDVEAPASMR